MTKSIVALALGLLLVGPGAAVAKKKTFVYVHDRQAGGGVYGFVMDKVGGLTPIPGSPFALVDEGGNCGANCQTLTYSKKRKTLYAGGPTGVSAWTVNPDGTLTVVPGSPFTPSGGGDFLGTGVVEAGKRVFVYSASFEDGNVYGWAANGDGSLVDLASSPFVSAAQAAGLATRKKFVFVANQCNDPIPPPSSLSSYVVAADGTLLPSPTSPFVTDSASCLYNVAPDQRGKYLYADDGFAGLAVLAIDKKTAALTPIAGSPFPTFTFGAGVLVAKKTAYVVGWETPQFSLQPFTLAKNGTPTPTSTDVIALPQPVDVFTTDKSARRMIFAGPNGVVTAHLDDKKTGSLTVLDEVDFAAPAFASGAVVAVR